MIDYRETKEISDVIKTFKEISGEIMIVFHKQGDPDALGAAVALKNFLSEINPRLKARIVSESLSSLANKILERIGEKINNFEVIENPETTHIALVDTNNPILCPFPEVFENTSGLRIVIDHHSPHPTTLAASDAYISDEAFSSAAEIIYCMYKHEGISLDETTATSLLAAFLFESRRFILADKYLFRAVADLLDMGIDYSSLVSLFITEVKFSERNARVKAAQRMKKVQIKDLILLITYIGAFEAAAARNLITLGGDFAAVISEKSNDIRVSLRASKKLILDLNISIGRDIADYVANKLDGTGGGHKNAAGMNFPSSLDPKMIESSILERIEELAQEKGLSD